MGRPAMNETLAPIQSEHALLGAAIYDPEHCADVLERVRPEHFYEPYHGRIWKRLQGGAASDDAILSQAFANDPAFEDFGGSRFFGDLLEKAMLPTVGVHADLVIDAATRRAVHAVATAAAGKATTQTGEGARIISDLERQLADVARDTSQTATSLGLDALEALEAAQRGEFRGEPTGIAAIDKVTSGIRKTDVWFIGGRTSMGKSVVGVEMALGIATQGRGVAFYSLEMPKVECQMRAIASLAFMRNEPDNPRYGDLLKGRHMPHDTLSRARHAARRLAELPIVIDDKGGLSIDDIRSRALRQVRAWEKAGIKPGAIIIDHIGLVSPSRQTDNKAADTAETVNQLKPLAKALQCPVAALVQVNRQTEGRNDKRPTMADLNWSGAIEQIADFVGLLYREAYYLARSPSRDDQDLADRHEHDLEIIIAKNRSGPICNVKAWVDVACNVVLEAG